MHGRIVLANSIVPDKSASAGTALIRTSVPADLYGQSDLNQPILLRTKKFPGTISLDLPFESDETNEPVARTLDYEGLHASLPSLPQ